MRRMLASVIGLGVGCLITFLPGPWPLAVALVGCGVLLWWVPRELLRLRRTKREIANIRAQTEEFKL